MPQTRVSNAPGRRPTLIAIVLAIMLAFLIGACGDDGDGGEATSGDAGADPAPNFAAQADAICIEDARQQLALRDGGAAGPEDELADIVEASIGELEQIEPPEAVGDAWDRYLDNRREAVEALREQAEAEGEAADEAAERVAELAEERDEIGSGLGVTACASRLSIEAEEEVTAVVGEAFTLNDPAKVCSELFSENFVAENFEGDTANCEEVLGAGQAANRIDVVEATGVDGVFSEVLAKTSGGQFGKTDIRVVLRYPDGAWVVDEFTGAASDG